MHLVLFSNGKVYNFVYNSFFKKIEGCQLNNCFYIKSLVNIKLDTYIIAFSNIWKQVGPNQDLNNIGALD